MILLRALVLLVGFAVAVFGGSVVVEAGLERLLGPGERKEILEFTQRGLRSGGKVIGWLERFLVVTFLLADSYAAIGLVLAAKGFIRYGEIKDAKDQKVAEYVLVGTMLSLSWAVVSGATLRWLIL